MSESKLYDRSRPKRSTTMPERPTHPYLFKRSRLRPRQTRTPPNEPEPSLDGDETSSDESGLGEDSDLEGEDNSSDEEEHAEDADLFAPSGVSGMRTQASISATTTMGDNQFATAAAATGSLSEAQTSSITASSTSRGLVQPSGSEIASSSSPPAVSSSDGPPQHTTAIVLGSLLGVLSVAVGAYLLFRFCTPLKTQVAAFRGRRGSKLPGEEGGVPPQQLGGGMIQSRESAVTNEIRYSKATASIATPAPSYTRGTAIAVLNTSTRVGTPISIHPASRDDDPDNPFSDYARSLSRNNSNKSIQSQQRSVQNRGAGGYENSRLTTDMLDGPDTYAFNFNFDDYRMSGTDTRPTGLTDNPPSFASGWGLNSRSNSVKRSVVPYPSGIGSGLGLDVATSLQTPRLARFPIPYASPSEVATPRTQYTPRLRQSITPSESVSNAPYSPLPLPASLMPAMPAMNSRWSKNSSSVWARTVDDKEANLPDAPARVISLTPPLPLTVGTSTSSLSSLSSNGSRRSSSRDSAIGTSQGSSEERSTFQPASAQRLKTVSAIVGLPTSVRPASNVGSGVTLKPVA